MKNLKLILLVLIVATCTLNAQEKNNFKDTRTGYEYNIIQIGNQWWFAENLSFKTTSGCYSYNNDGQNYYLHGYLYTWEAAKNACPAGWHLPSDKEWQTLIDFLGGNTIAGDKLKKPLEWQIPDIRTKDVCGFNALPSGGYSAYYNEFNYMGKSTLFWTSTQKNEKESWAVLIAKPHANCELMDININDAYSVRCVKD